MAVRFNITTADRLQEYCDAGKVGLDCNGFIGTYLRDVLGKKNVDGITVIDELLRQGRPMGKTDELDKLNFYVLGLVDSSNITIPQFSGSQIGHVMITTSFGYNLSGGVYQGKLYSGLHVVESTGGKGLVESDYLILKVENNGVFTVFRGSKQQTMRVRMSRVYI